MGHRNQPPSHCSAARLLDWESFAAVVADKRSLAFGISARILPGVRAFSFGAPFLVCTDRVTRSLSYAYGLAQFDPGIAPFNPSKSRTASIINSLITIRGSAPGDFPILALSAFVYSV